MKDKNKNYQIHKLEQRSEDWFAMREGMVTGSTAQRVKAKGEAYVYEVVATMITNTDPIELKTPAIEWGIKHEPKALAEYTKRTGHKVTEIGFITNGRVGHSPDGAVMKKEDINRLVEVKCPDTKTHVKYCIEDRIPREYMAQIINGFVVVDDCDIFDFVSYDPRCKVRPFFMKTITRQALGADIEVARIAYERHLKALDATYKQMIL